MATIEITPTSLVVHIEGMDQLWALKSRLEVPLQHVARADPTPPEAHEVFHGFKMGGSNLPGIITAGRFVHGGEWAFWDVHDPAQAVAIRLHDERYGKLVIGVHDPEAVAAQINAALQRP